MDIAHDARHDRERAQNARVLRRVDVQTPTHARGSWLVGFGQAVLQRVELILDSGG